MQYGVSEGNLTIRRGFAPTSLGQLHFRQAGEGPPLVLLHNTWLSSRMFLPVLPDLARHFTVYAIDTLGQGDSDPAPDRTLEIAEYAAVLLEALEALGLDRPSVAGHHTGSVIAAEAAVQRPDRLAKIVLSGLPYWRNPATRLAQEGQPFFADWHPDADGAFLSEIWKSHGGGGRYQLESAAQTFIDYLKPGPRTSIALRALFRWDSTERLPLITVPTLVLCAQTDGFVKNISHVQALIPGSELRIVPGADAHPLQDLAGFTTAVTEFCMRD
ncbi:MAG: alpha/beta hydrolase [Dehalococcoidia bacterium]